MLETTFDLIKAALKTDQSLTPAARSRIVEALRAKPAADSPTPSGKVDRIVRRKEAAARLSVSMRTVDKLARAGALQKRLLPGRKRACGFLESDLDALLKQQPQVVTE